MQARPPMSHQDLPDVSDIHLARVRIAQAAVPTPVIHSPEINRELGCKLYCKCENLQRTGAFKFRGAANVIGQLEEDGRPGDVATHSSGNHGAALALAAGLVGRKAHVVMPEDSSPMKIEAVRRYGGEVHFCAPGNRSRAEKLEALVATGLIPVHPYDHPGIIAGQGTAALELEQEVPSLEILMTPIGGGGLISGSAIASAAWGVTLYGAEPEGADDTIRSLEQGSIIGDFSPDTIADGLRALVGVRNFAIIRSRVRAVLAVNDTEIRQAMLLFWRCFKLTIEPSSATVIAAIRRYPERFQGRKVGVVISGGNIHPSLWSELVSGV
jgi:threonine dehydratase